MTLEDENRGLFKPTAQSQFQGNQTKLNQEIEPNMQTLSIVNVDDPTNALDATARRADLKATVKRYPGNKEVPEAYENADAAFEQNWDVRYRDIDIGFGKLNLIAIGTYIKTGSSTAPSSDSLRPS
jgi:hypothetical protein